MLIRNRKQEDIFENTGNAKADRSKRFADDHHAEKGKDQKVNRVEKVVGYHVIHFGVDLLSYKAGVFSVPSVSPNLYFCLLCIVSDMTKRMSASLKKSAKTTKG